MTVPKPCDQVSTPQHLAVDSLNNGRNLIAAVCGQGADVLVWFESISMVLYRRDGQRFDWLAALKRITQADEIGEWPVWILGGHSKPANEGRLKTGQRV